ncbi:hypothetical protein I5G81_gp92 [Mycobacterium phage Shandong1]|uniref:Uncharacterized protein n=1 Tax=Mycobacterium phage Shandong1 TaxID=1983447 RepID=A0A1X9SHH6_9CAUD|nr:hypothetical protein I5G81_gp92 [Mycobacterium phage Shandong1]ARQ95531.1 hypothetical protein [Mycobacterium phage Shandong1]
MSTINATAGLSFNLANVHGYVTGVTYGADGAVEVFAKAARHDEGPSAKYRMAHVTLGPKIRDCAYGAEYTVDSFRFITAEDFDRIVDMAAIRASLGWRD